MKSFNLKKHNPLYNMVNNSLLNLPTPFSISFLWNFGFLLGMTLMLQIISGLMLSMNFIAHTSLAFESVIHIMRDIDLGWIMRFLHMNGASLFFIFLYIHTLRGIYFNSAFKLPLVWLSGLIILLLSMMTAFMGYVLPWGQMSFWGATVITSMISAIPYFGLSITSWIWGNFSVSQPTLNRFFSLHFILPMVLTMFIIFHLILLHESGSSNPLGINTNLDKMKFFPNFMIKDLIPLIFIFLFFSLIIINFPNMLGDTENYNQASSTSTPTHIQPEWYFLYAYAILRAIPSKLGGVICMIMSILSLILLVFKKVKFNKKFSPYKKYIYWTFVFTCMVLSWIGSNPVEPPFVLLSMMMTFIYFMCVMNL